MLNESANYCVRDVTEKLVDDATKLLKFFITKKHIKAAKCGDEHNCVIAQAIKEAVPLVVSVKVGPSITLVEFEHMTLRYVTAKQLRDSLVNFDKKRGWDLPEGRYTLYPPPPSKKLLHNLDPDSRIQEMQGRREHEKKRAQRLHQSSGVNDKKVKVIHVRHIHMDGTPNFILK